MHGVEWKQYGIRKFLFFGFSLLGAIPVAMNTALPEPTREECSGMIG